MSSPFPRPFLRPGSLIIFAALLLYAVLIERKVSIYVGGSDSSAYYNAARLLSEGKVSTELRIIPGLPAGQPPITTPYIYIPYGFLPHSEGRMVTGYPIGMSLLMAATAPVTGWETAAGWTAGWHMLLAVVLMFVLGRECGLSVGWAGLGATVLGSSALFTAMGLQPMSDVPALTWCTASIYFALLSRRAPRWALAAGFALAIAILVRPTNILMFLPVALCLGVSTRWIWLGLGGLPGAALLAWFNYHAYGAIVTTGYGNMSGAFGAEWVLPTLAHYARWLPALFTPVVLLAFALPWTQAAPARVKTLLLTWMGLMLGFYLTYYFTHLVWWYLRFILPAMPPMLVAGLLVAQAWTRHRGWELFSFAATPRLRATSLALIVILVGSNYFWIQKYHTLDGKKNDSTFLKISEWLNTHAPANAVVAAGQASGSLYGYSAFPVIRWDALTPESTAAITAHLEAAGSPLYAVLFPYEREDALKNRMPGPWEQVADIKGVTLWKRGPSL